MAESGSDREPAGSHHDLLREVEDLIATIESDVEVRSIRAMAARVVEVMGLRLGLTGGRVYERDGFDYVQIATFPDDRVLSTVRVPDSYRPIELVRELRFVYMRADDPALDRELEERLGAREFAAIWIDGEGCDCIVAFDLMEGSVPIDVRLTLSILRYSIQHRLSAVWMGGVLEEARRIQASILPRRVPRYADFDMAGRVVSMEGIGGDFYDFIPLGPEMFGLAIADVSGHGLPAALQTRDIYTGLRMGLARDLKITRTVERLNRIVSRSTLTSRFVALFYGELSTNGLFIYVNAGHDAPFHVDAAGVATALTEGGPVLGPILDATYERGFVRLEPGDTLVFYTDGIVETEGVNGAESIEYGTDRLLAIVRECRDQSARETVEKVLEDVTRFDRLSQANDDRTVVIVKRPS